MNEFLFLSPLPLQFFHFINDPNQIKDTAKLKQFSQSVFMQLVLLIAALSREENVASWRPDISFFAECSR